MSKRGGRVPRPRKPGSSEWELRFGKKEAAGKWEEASNSWAGSCAEAWDELTADPRRRTRRQHQLRGSLATVTRRGKELELWQYELTGGGRIHYSIDDDPRTVWLEAVYPGHPKATERKKGRR